MTAGPVLVTGGSGFAGSYLIRELLDRGRAAVNFDVADYRAESRFTIGDRAASVPLERGSIDDWPRVMEVFLRHRPTAVVHAGGIMDVNYLDEHPRVALTTNVGGAVNLLEAARLVGSVERFVLLSTIAVIGRKLYEPIDAKHPTVTSRDGPLGAYSAAKAAAEAFAFTYLQTAGLDIRIVRPSALYGFGMSWYAPNYMKNIVEPAVLGEPVLLPTGGKVPRDYTNAADLAGLVLAILDGPDDADRLYYAATGRPLRTAADVCAIVRETVPGARVEIGDEWSESDLGELPLRGRYDISNARLGLGWEPSFPDLEDGIEDYVRRFRAYLDSGGVATPPPPDLQKAPGAGS
jgi:UDP-glucose 4-epimerase